MNILQTICGKTTRLQKEKRKHQKIETNFNIRKKDKIYYKKYIRMTKIILRFNWNQN